MLCEDFEKSLTSSSIFHYHRRQQQRDSVNSLNCRFFFRTFVRKFNLVHGRHDEQLSETMSS